MIEIRPRLAFGKKLLLSRVYTYTHGIFSESPESIRNRVSGSLGPDSSVCFLCFGNICRSPFAERYFEKNTEMDASSAGFYPESNRASPEAAVEAAAEFGVDLAAHESVTADRELIRQADIIFLMDFENLVDFNREFYDEDQKAVLLKQISTTNGLEIRDPYGKSAGEFRETYQQIADSIDSLETLFSS